VAVVVVVVVVVVTGWRAAGCGEALSRRRRRS